MCGQVVKPEASHSGDVHARTGLGLSAHGIFISLLLLNLHLFCFRKANWPVLSCVYSYSSTVDFKEAAIRSSTVTSRKAMTHKRCARWRVSVAGSVNSYSQLYRPVLSVDNTFPVLFIIIIIIIIIIN